MEKRVRRVLAESGNPLFRSPGDYGKIGVTGDSGNLSFLVIPKTQISR